MLLERERERPERNHVWEKDTRFVIKLCKFTFIIYESKNIFSCNFIFLIDYKENYNFSNNRMKMKRGPKCRRCFFFFVTIPFKDYIKPNK